MVVNKKFKKTKYDEIVKSQNSLHYVIPAEAGIQSRSERDLNAYKYSGLRFSPE